MVFSFSLYMNQFQTVFEHVCVLCPCVRVVLCWHKLARCDCLKRIHKIIINVFVRIEMVILFDKANPISSVSFLLLSFHVGSVLFLSSIIFFDNDYKLMALFTFPLLLEVLLLHKTPHTCSQCDRNRICIRALSFVWMCVGSSPVLFLFFQCQNVNI